MLRKYLYNGFADFIPMVAGFISAFILTRRFGLHRWGIYSQVLWLVGIMGILFSFGLTYGTSRYLARFSGEKKFSQLRKTIIFTGLLQILCSIFGGLILFSSAEVLLEVIHWHISPHFIRIAALGCVSFSLYQYSIFVIRGLQLFKLLAVYSGIYAAANVLIAFVCYQWPMVEVLLTATYLAQLLLLPWLWRHISRFVNIGRNDLSLDFPLEWQGIIRFSIVIYLTMLVDQIVWQRSEIFFLAKLPDAGQAGIYSLSYTIASVGIGVIPSAVTGVLTPVFTKEFARDGMNRLRDIYKSNFTLVNWLCLPLFIGMIVSAPVLLSDLFGSEFSSARGILILLIFSSMIAIYSRPSASLLHALNLPRVLLYGSLCALPADLFLAWQLVPHYGATGAAIANLTAQAFAGSIVTGYVILRVRVEYDWRLLAKALLGAGICCFAAWLVMSIIQIPIVRIFAASLIGLLVYILVLYKLDEEIAIHIVHRLLGVVQKYIPRFSPEP